MSFVARIGQYKIDSYPAEIAALEDWIIAQEAELIAMDINDMVAMESAGEDPNDTSKPSSFVTRIRNAFNKLRGAKKKGNESEVNRQRLKFHRQLKNSIKKPLMIVAMKKKVRNGRKRLRSLLRLRQPLLLLLVPLQLVVN